jgi:hypothetical protein
MLIKCPNKVEGIDATMTAIADECRTMSGTLAAMTSLNQEQLRHLEHNRGAVDALVKSHAPRDGREWWKTTEKSERIQEEIRDGIRDLVRLTKMNGGSR